MSNQNEKVTFEFDIKGERELLTAFEKAVIAHNKVDQTNKAVAQSYTAAEKAASSYDRALKSGAESAKRAQATVDSLREAYNKNTQAQNKGGKGGGSLGFDKGDLADVAGNLEQVFTGGTKVTSVIRDLVTSGGIAGAAFIALSAALDLVKTAIDNENKAFEQQRNVIARTSATFEEYQQRRREAAEQNKVAAALEQFGTGFEAGRTQGTSVFDPKFAENIKKVESEQKRLNDTRQVRPFPRSHRETMPR